MTPEEALTLVQVRGVMLESGSGSEASMAELVAGASIRGSWWAHPQGREIFTVTRAVRSHQDVLVCRLVGGKITYVHRALWPALVRLSERLPTPALAKVREIHTPTGKHVTHETPYPHWVPPEVSDAAHKLSEATALSQLPLWVKGDLASLMGG